MVSEYLTIGNVGAVEDLADIIVNIKAPPCNKYQLLEIMRHFMPKWMEEFEQEPCLPNSETSRPRRLLKFLIERRDELVSETPELYLCPPPLTLEQRVSALEARPS